MSYSKAVCRVLTVTNSPDYDAMVGENLRRLRTAKAVSQSELAKRLEQRGLPFRQQTVVKIEKGQRPLRLREAHEIASVLDLNIDDLVMESYERDDAALLVAHTTELIVRWDALQEATRNLVNQLNILAWTVDRVADSGIPKHLLDEAFTYLQVDPMKVVVAGIEAAERLKHAQAAEYDSGVEYRRYPGGVD